MGFYWNSDIVSAISINEGTGQVLDIDKCTVFDYPSLEGSKKTLARRQECHPCLSRSLAKRLGANLSDGSASLGRLRNYPRCKPQAVPSVATLLRLCFYRDSRRPGIKEHVTPEWRATLDCFAGTPSRHASPLAIYSKIIPHRVAR